MSFLKAIYNKLPFNNRFSIVRGNNIFKVDNSVLQKCEVQICGKGNHIEIGNHCFMKKCRIIIKGNNNRIILCDEVNSDRVEFYFEDDNGSILIGKSTSLGQCHLACIEGKTIRIGDDCLFSSEIVFRTGDSHSVIDSTRTRINPSKDIIVGNHVWIGHRATINKGVEIPANSIVASCAVVTKPFTMSNVVIAGNPAITVKENINWVTKRI